MVPIRLESIFSRGQLELLDKIRLMFTSKGKNSQVVWGRIVCTLKVPAVQPWILGEVTS